jgi:hypothetical protein
MSVDFKNNTNQIVSINPVVKEQTPIKKSISFGEAAIIALETGEHIIADQSDKSVKDHYLNKISALSKKKKTNPLNIILRDELSFFIQNGISTSALKINGNDPDVVTVRPKTLRQTWNNFKKVGFVETCNRVVAAYRYDV